MEENLHSDGRFVCTDANAFMRLRAVERHLRWPSQVTLSPPKAKLCEGHWQRFWPFAAGTSQCCCGHPSFWIRKQHSVDFGLLTPAWSHIHFLITPPSFCVLMEPIYIRLRENFVFLLFTASPTFHSYAWEKETAKYIFLQFIEFVPPELHSRLRNYGFNPLCPRIDLYYLFSSLPDIE